MTVTEAVAAARGAALASPGRRLLPYVVLLVLSLALVGCGVGATASPVDEGDAADGSSAVSAARRDPPGPDLATSADEQVRNFLQAAAGGNSAAVNWMKPYFTPRGLAAWPGPTSDVLPTVVRLTKPPTSGASIGGRTPVTVTYETIGLLNDSGRIDDLVGLAPGAAPQELRFWVVANPAGGPSLRIDEIEGWPAGALLLSDEGLQNQYQMQPIYFWDMEYGLLVPDLRYMPTRLTPDQRAKQVLNWLVRGPSPWVSGVQPLPVGTSEPLVVTLPDGAFAVDLSAAVVGTGEPEVVRKLGYQLQWSFAALTGGDATPEIELRIEGMAPVRIGKDDRFRDYNHSWSYHDRDPVHYDIGADGVVVASGAAPSLLASPENTGVREAAISLDESAAAFVRQDNSGLRSLQIVGPAGVVSAQVPANSTLGRPIFVPGTNVVLAPTGVDDGRVFAVSTKDGSGRVVSHTLDEVTAVSVSPDGRRVAYVADGEVFVSSLVVGNGEVTVASQPRQILANKLDARTVTWTAESWLLVAGSNTAGQALWRSSADGVLVEDLSGNLDGLIVQDLVSYPRWTGSPRWLNRGTGDVLAVASTGIVYSFRTRPSEETGVAPFFAS